MRAAWRAGASIAMLLGFYAVALAQLAVVVAGTVWAFRSSHALLGAKIGGPLLLACGAAFTGLWRALRHRDGEPPGVPVEPGRAPELWAQITALAAEAGTRAPDELRLIAEPNAAVSERTRLLGLVAGARRLYLGLPLLHALTVDQLRSVLAHELGHYSGRHTRLGGIAYRGRLAIVHTVGRISRRNPAGWAFRGWLRLYLLVDTAGQRRQELEADAASVRVAGPAVASATLRELPVLDAAWAFFLDRHVHPGLATGRVPDDVFGGFRQFLAARHDELAELRAQEPRRDASARWSTHPPLTVRLAAMAVAPARERPADGRPAGDLLPDLAGWGRALQAQVLRDGGHRPVSWDEFAAATIVAGQQRLADAVFRALARRTGRAVVPGIGLAELLDLVAAGRLGEVAAEVLPDVGRDEAAERFAGPMTEILELAAVRSQVAQWRHGWTGPPVLVDRAGYPLDLVKTGRLACAPWTLGEARDQLAALGVNLWHTGLVETRPGPRGTLVRAAMTLDVGGAKTDVVLLDRGFVLVPAEAGGGRARLRGLVGSASGDELAGRHAFVPFDDVEGGTAGRFRTVRARLALRGGDTMTLRERFLGAATLDDESRDEFLGALRALTRRRTGRHGR